MSLFSRCLTFAMLALGSVLILNRPELGAQEGSEKEALVAAVQRGQTLTDEGDWAAAIKQYERAVALAPRVYGSGHIQTAKLLNELAELCRRLGQSDRAEPLYRRSLKIYETQFGLDHEYVATSLNNLAALYRDTGQYSESETLLQRSLKIREARLGPDHLAVATSLNNLAELYQRTDRRAQAEPLLRRSLKIRQDNLGPDHPEVAQSLNDLGHLYESLGHSDQAERLFQRSLKIYRDKLGADHPYTATCLNNLARVYHSMGQLEKAEPFYLRSLQVYENKLGPEHPHVATTLNKLARLYASRERWKDATELTDQTRRLVRRYGSRNLSVMSEREQLTFLQTRDAVSFHQALSLGLVRRNEARTATRSADWVLNGKAVAQQALAERTLLARDGTDAHLTKVVRQLLTARKQLASLTLTSPAPGAEAGHRNQLARLAESEQALVKQLGQASGRQGWRDPWVDLDEVRRALPADAVLVEIAKFPVWDFRDTGKQRASQEARYVAWVVPPTGKGSIQVVDLGEAAKIDAAVKSVRQALQTASKTIRDLGEPNSEKELRRQTDELAQLVLQPLAARIGSIKRWILSPDSALWLVPWSALPLTDGRYAIEELQISFLVSGRDLVRTPFKIQTTRPLVLADPDYDMGPEAVRAAAQRLRLGQEPAGMRGLPGSLRLGKAPRLPGTAVEAQAITPELRSYAGAEPAVYLDRQALKRVFREARSPKVVVLSTHGYFLDDPDVAPGTDERGERPRTGSAGPVDNPLLKCGLLFAGANHQGEARDAGDEDGVLTGLEIVGTDLRGTDLVVLSACETGLGQIRNGEGVAGLRQAFQLAGAQAVVATLWQIPDRETARLMGDFFARLAEGKSKADALRKAQLALIKARRDRNGAAHPLFWAAFTVTGL